MILFLETLKFPSKDHKLAVLLINYLDILWCFNSPEWGDFFEIRLKLLFVSNC